MQSSAVASKDSLIFNKLGEGQIKKETNLDFNLFDVFEHFHNHSIQLIIA
jgi:hypothetical protein